MLLNVRSPGSYAATALVVASMIGTGVFTSLGFQLTDLTSGPQILFLWLLGGLIALSGALCYAAVAEALPRSGGEHHFLTELYHPALGFMAGILSAVVGFAAPTAITALAFGEYLHKALPEVNVSAAAVGVILAGSAAHAISAQTSARVQLGATSLKLLLILLFLGAVFLLPGKGDIRWTPEPSTDLASVLQPAFATSLFFVFYSYSGWNAAVYGLEEWEHPECTVRRALIGGTLLVTVLYLALNAAFLHAAPVEALRGEVAVGEISARHLFGDRAAAPVAGLFAVGLFASVSAMLWAGPRVLAAMGNSTPALRFLTQKSGTPLMALGLQTLMAIGFVFASGFRELVTYTQTGLALCTLLTVAGVFLLGKRVNRSRLILPAIIFLAMTSFVVIRSLTAEPIPTLAGLATALAIAIAGYFLTKPSNS